MQLGHTQKYDARQDRLRSVPVVNDRRFSHTWVLGKTGMGKSTAMLRWMVDDVRAGAGFALVDLDGQVADLLMTHIPRTRRADTILFDPTQVAIGFNPFDTIPEERRSFTASSLVDTFKSVWGYAGVATPVLDQFLYNGARALMDRPGGTLFELKFLLTSEPFRTRVLQSTRDPVVHDFWQHDFGERLSEREQAERTQSTLNKIGALIADPFIRQTIGQKRSRLDFAKILGRGQILIIRLPRSRLGEEKAALLASLLLSQMHLAVLGREGEHLAPFHLFLDDCHLLAPNVLTALMSSAGRANVSLAMANQFLGQLDPGLREAMIGTIGTLVAFRLGPSDADRLASEFRLTHDDYSLVELKPYTAYARRDLTTTLLQMPTAPRGKYPTSPAKIRNAMQAGLGVDRATLETRLARFVENQNRD